MAISHRSLPLYGLQFHPEAVLSEYGKELITTFAAWPKPVRERPVTVMTESVIRRSPFPYTASQLFALFADEKDAVFLDSSLTNDLGRYSLIGLVPYHTVSVEQGQLQVDGKAHEGTAETYLKAYLKKELPAQSDRPALDSRGHRLCQL